MATPNNDAQKIACNIFKMLFQNFMKSRTGNAGPSAMSGTMGAKDFAGVFGSIVAGSDEKWKETNIGGIGSDQDKQLRKEAAESEPQFRGAGQQVGLEIWRVEKFKPMRLDRAEYGVFNEGDSYIILNTYQLPNKNRFEYDLHYWQGKDSTQDEKGASAYFTVNLDDLLGTLAVQHREVQGSESDLMLSYFGGKIQYRAGGVPSGFQEGGVAFTATPGSTGSRSLPAQSEVISCSKKLFKISDQSGKMEIVLVEEGATLHRANLNSDDVFMALSSEEGFVLFGKSCSKQERLFVTDAAGYILVQAGFAPSTRLTFVNEGDETPTVLAVFA